MRLGVVVLGALWLGACGTNQPAIIGFAQGTAEDPVRRVLDSVLAELPAGGGPEIRILHSRPAPVTPGSSALSDEIQHALSFAATAGLVGVVGHAGSSETLLAARVYNEAGVPQVVPTSTSRRLATAGPWTFRMAPDDSVEGEFIGDLVTRRLGAKSATLFYITQEYGLGLAAGVTAALERRGIPLLERIPIRHDAYCLDAPDSLIYDRSASLGLAAGRPDVVVIAGRTREAACLMRSLAKHTSGLRFVAGDGVVAGAEVAETAGAAADSLYLIGFWHHDRPEPVSRAFARRFQEVTGTVPNHADAMLYDGVMLLAEAVRVAGPDRSSIREYLESLGEVRPPYPGVTGPVAFTGGSRRPLVVLRPKSGGVELMPDPQ